MSIYVLKRKLDNKTRHNTVNASGGGFKLAVTNTGVNKSKCSSDYAKMPIIQQSYRNLYKRRLRYFVEPKTTFKRMPESSSKQHLENKTSAAINCDVKVNTADKMISASDQIARVKARRACGNYEMEISGNSASKSVCP
jgi:hypothetical protein